MPILQKQAYVKWWPRFDASKATRESIITWFKANLKYLQVADPQNCLFLNQKAQITAALAASSSEDDFVQNLQGVLRLLEQDKEKKKGKHDLSSSSSTTYVPINEDDFGIYYQIDLAED